MTRGFQLSSKVKYKKAPKPAEVHADLRPQLRNGEPVTIANCTSQECRWPYGLPGPEMVMCGRNKVWGKPYCPEHQKLVKRTTPGIY